MKGFLRAAARMFERAVRVKSRPSVTRLLGEIRPEVVSGGHGFEARHSPQFFKGLVRSTQDILRSGYHLGTTETDFEGSWRHGEAPYTRTPAFPGGEVLRNG